MSTQTMDTAGGLAAGKPDARSESATSRVCPACRAGGLRVFAELMDVPTHIGVQWPTRELARDCERGDIRLGFCERCLFVTNVAFAPQVVDYDQTYENDLSHSPKFQVFERDLIARLNRDYALAGKHVVEIGCGSGGFLRRLCAETGCTGTGFDPCLGHSTRLSENVELVADYYPDGRGPIDADLIVCRQVFEHVPDPLSFLAELRAGLRRESALYFEVPSFDYVLDDLALWTVIYEHCSYFTADALAGVFTGAGFEVRTVWSAFDDQFLAIEAQPGRMEAGAEDALRAIDPCFAERFQSFARRLSEKVAFWKGTLDQFRSHGRRVVVWGAGARAVSFLNLIEGSDFVQYAVDINPNKAGKFLPGSGQEIVGPAFLTEYRPDAIIVMNAIYLAEIRQYVESLGVQSELLPA